VGVFDFDFWGSPRTLCIFQYSNEKVKIDKNKFVSFVSLVVYLTGPMPIQGMCFENGAKAKNMAKDLLAYVETGTEGTVSYKIKELEVFFENAPNAFEEGRTFIQSFVDEMN
jgi:hypothetical protein